MNTFMTIIVGGIIGWLASTRIRTEGPSGIAAIVIAGVVGSFVGSFLAGMLGIGGTGAIAGAMTAIVGAGLMIMALDKAGVFESMLT